MIETLNTCYKLAIDLGTTLISFCADILVWGGDLLVQLDNSWPRITGLLLGIVLTWLMVRRDKHPFIRAISAPLKLVIDILDLIWDHSVDFVGETLGIVWNWQLSGWRRLGSWIKGGWRRGIDCLENAKLKLSKARDD